MVKTIKKTPLKKSIKTRKSTKPSASRINKKIIKPSKKKPLHKKFAGLFKGRQQKGKVAVAGVAVMMFASVGAYLLFTSFAATPATAPTGTYTDWNWPGQNYTSFDWQVTPGIDQAGPDAYFYSHQFGFVGGDGGYAGMQGDNNGKRAIFSIWQALAARGPETAQPFGGEGTGYQTVIKYSWTAGRVYKYHLQKTTTDADGNWWAASVTDSITGVMSPIGEIKVPLAWGALSNFSIVWTERYGGQMSTCDDIHHSSVTFTNFSANSGTVFPTSHNNHLGQPVNCPGSQISDTRNGVVQQMGVGNDLPPVIPAGAGTSLGDLSPTYVTTGYGTLQKDRTVDSHTITLNGQRYARGLGSHANADIRYNLAGKYAKFVANVGVDDEVANSGSVAFQVWADGTKLYDSGTMIGPAPGQTVNVDVTGKQELKLIVTDAGDGISYDHADWADARLATAGDTTAPTATVSSPVNNSMVSYITYINATASDNVGTVKMETYIDGVLRYTTAASSSSFTWGSYYASAGSHTIIVKAYDAAGNIGQSTVTVTK